MEKIAVVGSGSIGPDLCYGFASALAKEDAVVVLHDISQEQLDQGLERIQGYLAKGLDRGKISPAAAARVRDSIKPSLDIQDLRGCSYVLEAATENLEAKRRILAGVEAVVDADCLIGFATSGIPRAQIVRDVRHPGRCFVNHPFYPAWRSLPVELVASGDAALTRRMYQLLQRLGKVPVLTADVHCFAADDVFCNFECEAFRLLEDGVANRWQIDRIINEAVGGGGPFRVADLTRGNLLIDHCQQLMVEAHKGNPWFRSPRILLEQGNTLWRDPERQESSDYGPELAEAVMARILAVLFARAFAIVDEGVCEPGDLDWLLMNSLGFKEGILELAAGLGMGRVRALCEAYAARDAGFEVPESIRLERFPAYRRHVLMEGPDPDGISLVQVRRPEAVNALNARTVAELRETFAGLRADPAVRGVVFSGFGPGLAGADILELAALQTTAECEAVCAGGQPLGLEIEALGKPVVAAVRGPVLGGGAELCMAAWARVIEEGALVGQPEVNLGIIPGYGATQRLPRLVGPAKACELLATGRPMNASQACEAGWATGAPVPDAVEGARKLIHRHLEGVVRLAPLDASPLPAAALVWPEIGGHSLATDDILREVLEEGLRLPLAEGLRVEARGFGRCRATQDMGIGMANFLQNGPVPAVFVNR